MPRTQAQEGKATAGAFSPPPTHRAPSPRLGPVEATCGVPSFTTSYLCSPSSLFCWDASLASPSCSRSPATTLPPALVTSCPI